MKKKSCISPLCALALSTSFFALNISTVWAESAKPVTPVAVAATPLNGQGVHQPAAAGRPSAVGAPTPARPPMDHATFMVKRLKTMLDITDDQAKKIGDIIKASDDQVKKIKEDSQTKIKKVLTPEQLKKMETMPQGFVPMPGQPGLKPGAMPGSGASVPTPTPNPAKP